MEELIKKTWEYFGDFREREQSCSDDRLKQKIQKQMEEGYRDPDYTLVFMAQELNMSEKKLYHEFKKMYGVTFASYLETMRITRAQELLTAQRPVGEVAREVGYGSDYSFRRAFKRVVGVPPSDYQKL